MIDHFGFTVAALSEKCFAMGAPIRVPTAEDEVSMTMIVVVMMMMMMMMMTTTMRMVIIIMLMIISRARQRESAKG